MIRLATPRLVLRAFRASDRDDLVALDADPEVREYLDMPQGTAPEEAEEHLAHYAETYPEGSRRGFWAAEEEGRFVGWFHLRPSRDTGECELGYRLRRDAWGRGLATEGSQALIDLAFADGEPRVVASTDVANRRSQRVMEKLGMARTREFLYEGRLPSVEYATTAAPAAS